MQGSTEGSTTSFAAVMVCSGCDSGSTHAFDPCVQVLGALPSLVDKHTTLELCSASWRRPHMWMARGEMARFGAATDKSRSWKRGPVTPAVCDATTELSPSRAAFVASQSASGALTSSNSELCDGESNYMRALGLLFRPAFLALFDTWVSPGWRSLSRCLQGVVRGRPGVRSAGFGPEEGR